VSLLRQRAPLAVTVAMLCAWSVFAHTPRVGADAAAYCAPDQPLDWQPVLVPLSQQLGDTMGQPVECPHPAGDNDDIVQQTTTGLAIVRSTTGAPTFTDGTTRWALIASNVLNWTDSGLDPPRGDLVCAQQPARGFGLVFNTQPEAYQLLGCPTLGEVGLNVAVQRFEHGWMVWEARRGTTPPTIHTLFDDNQQYARFDDTYAPDTDPAGASITPPPGLFQPMRGFGKVWREGIAVAVRDRLGWAIAPEFGGAGAVEAFQRGLMVFTPDPREIFVLAASTSDRPAQVLQVWRAYADTFSE